ncbi:hypothetical protein ACGFT2_24020 [Streptomyces sp. NPDC048514]|uniref:hypothetical protein n=1 Tax=Streptomyces sp. NPDC048514 TaxID=3365564 RepID=UPI0037106E53
MDRPVERVLLLAPDPETPVPVREAWLLSGGAVATPDSRRLVRGRLALWDVAPATVDRVVFACSDIVTAAVHCARSPVLLWLDRLPSAIVLGLRYSGPPVSWQRAASVPVDGEEPEPDLRFLARFIDRWEDFTLRGTTTVEATFRVGPP